MLFITYGVSESVVGVVRITAEMKTRRHLCLERHGRAGVVRLEGLVRQYICSSSKVL
jgi:hypothetical protein